jgi:RNase P/RNase MRP subunit p30
VKYVDTVWLHDGDCEYPTNVRSEERTFCQDFDEEADLPQDGMIKYHGTGECCLINTRKIIKMRKVPAYKKKLERKLIIDNDLDWFEEKDLKRRYRIEEEGEKQLRELEEKMRSLLI